MRGARLPVGLRLEGVPADRQRLRHHAAGRAAESDRLPEPIFTPATKADTGHDVNISEAEAGGIVGARARRSGSKELTLEIYRRGCEHAESKGIIIADTKFEFGLVGG